MGKTEIVIYYCLIADIFTKEGKAETVQHSSK